VAGPWARDPVVGIFISGKTGPGTRVGRVTCLNVEKGTVYKGHPCGQLRRVSA
jgi:hypothetical protein